MAVGAAGLIFWFAYYRNVEAQQGPVIQKNEGAPNFNVLGNNNQFNIYPPSQRRSESDPNIGRVAHFQFSERAIASSKPDLPFSLRITTLTDAIIENPAFVITCDGPIAEGHAGAGAGIYIMTENLITYDKRSFGFRWAKPDFIPETPLVVTLFSAGEIHCPELKDARLIKFDHSLESVWRVRLGTSAFRASW